MFNPLKKWIFDNKYYIKTTDPKEKKVNPTHYLLDGGIWKVPIEKYSTFLGLLATDLENGEKHYISENKTEIFRFICDLDFYEDTIISIKQIEIIVNTIQEVTTKYFGKNDVILCGSDSKNVNNLIKSGFHLVWPDIWVTTRTAKELRLKFIEILLNTYGARNPDNSWEDVVDLAVYEDNGLRMIGCRKMGICKSCKNKKEFRETCESCDKTGKIDENRVYSVINNKYDNYLQVVLNTSIYNYQSLPETNLITPLPTTVIKKQPRKVKDTQQDEETIKIENFIKRNFKESYSKVQIKKITQSDDSSRYFVEIEDNFCSNVNRNHSSSGVYFQIKSSGICQRCHCKKTTTDGRLFGPCFGFSSKEVPLSKPLQTLLFGQVIKGKNKKIVNVNILRSTNREMCINNCKNILWQLENDLRK